MEDCHEPAADAEAAADDAAENAAADFAGDDRMLHMTLLGLSIGVIALSFVLAVRDQATVVVPIVGFPLPEVCSLKRMTGIECPGCGLTRSFISTARGQWRQAWHFNPVGPFFFLVVAAQIPYRAWQLWRLHRGLHEFQLRRLTLALLVGLVVGLLTQWIIRLVT